MRKTKTVNQPGRGGHDVLLARSRDRNRLSSKGQALGRAHKQGWESVGRVPGSCHPVHWPMQWLPPLCSDADRLCDLNSQRDSWRPGGCQGSLEASCAPRPPETHPVRLRPGRDRDTGPFSVRVMAKAWTLVVVTKVCGDALG